MASGVSASGRRNYKAALTGIMGNTWKKLADNKE